MGLTFYTQGIMVKIEHQNQLHQDWCETEGKIMKRPLLTSLAIAIVMLLGVESIAMATPSRITDLGAIAQASGDDGCPGDPSKDC